MQMESSETDPVARLALCLARGEHERRRGLPRTPCLVVERAATGERIEFIGEDGGALMQRASADATPAPLTDELAGAFVIKLMRPLRLDSPLWRRVRAEGGGGFRHRLGALARLLWAGGPSAEVDTRDTSELGRFARTRWASMADDVRVALVRALAASGSGGGGATPLLPPLAAPLVPLGAAGSRLRVAIISVERHRERYAETRRRVEAAGHAPERIVRWPGIDAFDEARSRPVFEALGWTAAAEAAASGASDTPGWLGCAASHLLLWRRLAAGGPLAIDGGGGGGGGGRGGGGDVAIDDALTLVLEDDAMLPREWAVLLEVVLAALAAAPADFLVAFLGYCFGAPSRRRTSRSSCAATRCATTRTSCRGAARRAWSRCSSRRRSRSPSTSRSARAR